MLVENCQIQIPKCFLYFRLNHPQAVGKSLWKSKQEITYKSKHKKRKPAEGSGYVHSSLWILIENCIDESVVFEGTNVVILKERTQVLAKHR